VRKIALNHQAARPTFVCCTQTVRTKPHIVTGHNTQAGRAFSSSELGRPTGAAEHRRSTWRLKTRGKASQRFVHQ